VAASMKTMDRYIETCKFLDKNGSYMSLIKAVKTLYVRLCKTGSFQTGNVYKNTVKLKGFEHVSLINKLHIIQFL
jgi:hypothetical protein